MKPNCNNFKDLVAKSFGDETLQKALKRTSVGFPALRQHAVDAMPEFEALRDDARDMKNHVLANLDLYLQRFEAKVIENGGQVHWARDSAEANKIILDICRSVDAKTVTKGKSMIGEELAINAYLEDAGIEPVETDLGEYIIQLRGETPSHIVGPAIHVSKEQVAENFRAAHTDRDPNRPLDEPKQLLNEAREVLREKFLIADVGITGANMLIAETGTSVIVTNEGNGDLTQTLPKVHIALASLEKVVPTLEDAMTILRVLARSITGQEQTVYNTFSTGPRRPEDPDGPEQYHVVLLDNGRSKLLGTQFQDMLRCIRCGTCLGFCPVYTTIGGHAYGWIYTGPMGAMLTPALLGIGQSGHLPNASTFCGRCEEVCPMRIPIPKLLRQWRAEQHRTHRVPLAKRIGLAGWGWFARHPGLYHWAAGIKMPIIAALGRKKGSFSKLPGNAEWSKGRDFPAPQGKTFQSQWDAKGGRR